MNLPETTTIQLIVYSFTLQN